MMARGLFRYGMTAAAAGMGLLVVAAAPSRVLAEHGA